MSYFIFKNGNWIARPKGHVTSTRDIILCVKDQTNMAERKKTERKGELLDKLAKLSDSEPIDIFLKGQCHEDCAVLGQFRAKIITLRLYS